MTIDEKYEQLIAFLKSRESAAVAFSGGVDSSFLCHAAADAIGDRAVAITVISPFLPQIEIEAAKEIARRIGIAHFFVEEPEIPEEVAANPKDRCYHCKKIEFSRILAAAQAMGIPFVLDGSNLDDLIDYRPGMKALEELEIVSPLKEVGLTKAEIRDLSRSFGLPTWNKPAFACLASRIPYGERIDKETLSRVEKAEDVMRSFGFRQFRVRAHGDIARIEVDPAERRGFFDESKLDAISRSLKECGFLYAAFELEGYSQGNLNRAI